MTESLTIDEYYQNPTSPEDLPTLYRTGVAYYICDQDMLQRWAIGRYNCILWALREDGTESGLETLDEFQDSLPDFLETNLIYAFECSDFEEWYSAGNLTSKETEDKL